MAAADALSPVARYPALEALGDAWSAAGALRLFNDMVLPRAWPERRATRVAVEDVSHIPGRACVVLYVLHFGDGGPAHRAAATFAKDDRLQRVFAEHYGARPPSRGGDEARPVVLLPERRCLVEFFGMDWQLPALAHATDPARMAPVLSRLGYGPPAAVHVLRYRPHQRCVLRYACGGRHVIGKIYRRAENADAVWSLMRALHSSLDGGAVVLPAPLARVEQSLLLSEGLDGCGWTDALLRSPGSHEAAPLLAAAAAAAAALHAVPACAGEPQTFASELARLRTRIDRVAPAAPGLAADATAVLDRLGEDRACTGPVPITLVHGDFKPDQLLLGSRGLAVLDLDCAGPGDPAVDLGNFIAQFHREALTPGQEGLRTLAEPFLAEYERLAGAQDIADRARRFRTLALVRMAVRRFVHFPHLYARAGAPSPPGPLLAEAASCLD